MATKRPYVVQGNTPGKPTSKRSSQGKSRRRSLFESNPPTSEHPEKASGSKSEWTLKEKSALLQYICLFWEGAWNNKWPMTKDNSFWNSCAHAVNNACQSNRTGLSLFMAFHGIYKFYSIS